MGGEKPAVRQVPAENVAVMQLDGHPGNPIYKQGALWHAVELEPEYDVTTETPAFCGRRDGPKSYGWVRATDPEQKVTCPKCLKQLEQMFKP